MKRHMGWLGWVLAGVIAVGAAGAAVAAESAGSASPTTTGATAAAPQGQGGHLVGLARLGRLLPRLRRAVHGEATLRTKDGFQTVVYARGKVTAVSGSSVTITSPDNVATAFALGADTRYGSRRRPGGKADLKVGVSAAAFGVRSGSGVDARRVVVLPVSG
jgi:hypothetical protein